MVLKVDQDRVRTLLRDTITLLCKNGLEFSDKFKLDALIGVTLDDNNVFLMTINEIIKSDSYTSPAASVDGRDSSPEKETHSKRKRKKSKCEHEPSIKMETKSSCFDEDTGLNNTKSARLDEAVSNNLDSRSSLQSKSCHDNADSVPPETDDDPDEEIIFIKEEIQDSWEQIGAHDGKDDMNNKTFQSDSLLYQSQMDSAQQDTNFPLSDMTLVPIGLQDSGGFMQHTAQSRMPQATQFTSNRTATVTSQQQFFHGNPQDHDSQQDLAAPADENLVCRQCGKVFKMKELLHRHLRWHAGIYDRNCKICGKGFMSGTSLRGHMALHTGVKEFWCNICGKGFAYKFSLKNHSCKK